MARRDIARAFGLKTTDRALKILLASMIEEGELVRGTNRRYTAPSKLPPVGVIEITGIDGDGDPIGRPVSWRNQESSPRITVVTTRRDRNPALAIGERALVRLKAIDLNNVEARVMRRLEVQSGQVVGVIEKDLAGTRLKAIDRRGPKDILLSPEVSGTVEPGDVVVAEMGNQRGHGGPSAKISKRLGQVNTPGVIERMLCAELGIPTEFSSDVNAAAKKAVIPRVKGRVDLQSLPLVTIDDADAKDFDDAVWATQDLDPDNPGGWRLIVAIADVAAYVKPGDPIDQEARRRGNSVYLPRLVVPMLPEALCNGWCSLKENETRACLAAHIWIARDGSILRHRFERALMKSTARLTYAAVQAAREGTPDTTTRPILQEINSLYGAYSSLKESRTERKTLDFDLPERKIIFNDSEDVQEISIRPRYESHRLIEEFMIAANVAAAEVLSNANAPCMYRVHNQPPLDKLEILRSYLRGLGYKLSRSRRLTPQHFQQILNKTKGSEHEEAVATTILQAQSQAEYSPENIGHFGLNLQRYAHFTSPIRRYADLLVHRSLIRHLHLGTDGLLDQDSANFAVTAADISATERRAVRAERGANDRYKTLFMADKRGAEFAAKVTSVTRFGLFITINDIGAEGLIPMRVLSHQLEERVFHDTGRLLLTARRNGVSFGIGHRVSVRLDEADTITGGLTFSLAAFDPPRVANSRVGSRRRHRQ